MQTGDNVGIGGFIITGTAPKHVLLRAIGPSLAQVRSARSRWPTRCWNCTVQSGFITITNDNWRDDPVQEAAIIATGSRRPIISNQRSMRP